MSLKINASADIIRNYSYLISHLAGTDLIPAKNKRKFMLSEMELRFINEDALTNLWCTFEPNALDGMDAQFINQVGSDDYGIFSPWFDDGDLIDITIDDYSQDYYAIPKLTGKEAVSEPYWEHVNDKEVLMISFSAPVILNDTFLGVVGTDFYIDILRETIHLHNRLGNNKFVTDNGVIVLHNNPELIGERDDSNYEEIINKLSSNEIYDDFFISENGNKIYKVFIPVWFGKTEKPWLYIVEIPAKQIYSDVRKIISIAVIAVLFFVFLVYFYIYHQRQKMNELIRLKRFLMQHSRNQYGARYDF